VTTQAVGVCASCSQPLHGRYCSRCGEEAHDPTTLTVGHFVTHTLAHETLHLDGKIWRTLRLLVTRPGLLSAEYCAGRRRLYINPVRIFITAIIVYAVLTQGGLQMSLFIGPVVLSVAPAAAPKGASISQTVERIDRYGMLERQLVAKRQSVDLTSDATRERFHAKLDKFSEPLSFANVILVAIALHALFHRRRQLFVEHAVFSMHFMSFVLFSTLLFRPALFLVNVGSRALVLVSIAAIIVWQFVYLAVAIRRFYFGDDARRFRPAVLATAAALLMYVVNSAFITATQMLGGALALWTL
jgi:uncharacterized protein DUF3667